MKSKREKIRYGVLGCGIRGFSLGIAENSDLRKHPDAELVAVCDHRQKQLDEVRLSISGDIALYTDVDAFLCHPGLDAVYVATPDAAHHQNALQVLRAKKHILLEKPMAQVTAHCDEILQEWQKAGVTFGMFLELRWCNFFEKVKEILGSGALGKIVMVNAIDNVQPGGRYFFHNYFRRRETGISLVLQKGCHTLDLASWFIGSSPRSVYALNGLAYFGGQKKTGLRCENCPDKPACPEAVESVFLYGNTRMVKEDMCCFAPDVDMADHNMALVKYYNGVKLFYQECHFTPEYTRDFSFIGTNGKLSASYGASSKIILQDRFSRKIDEFEVPEAEGTHGGGDPKLVDDFIRCIFSKDTPRADILSGRNSTALAMAMEESAEKDSPVEIPPPSL